MSFRRRGRRQVDTPRSERLLLLTRGIQSGELHNLLKEHVDGPQFAAALSFKQIQDQQG